MRKGCGEESVDGVWRYFLSRGPVPFSGVRPPAGWFQCEFLCGGCCCCFWSVGVGTCMFSNVVWV
jgi:hypothetical protein